MWINFNHNKYKKLKEVLRKRQQKGVNDIMKRESEVCLHSWNPVQLMMKHWLR